MKRERRMFPAVEEQLDAPYIRDWMNVISKSVNAMFAGVIAKEHAFSRHP